MKRGLVLVTTLALAAGAAWFAYGRSANAGTALQIVNFPAPAFIARADSVHNNGTTHVCGAFVAHNDPPDDGENHGDLNNGKGSYLQFVRLPQGAVVKRMTLFANDADAAANDHVFLVRKSLARGQAMPKQTGYRVMAHARTAGAVNDVMRGFSDGTIARATIDNEHYMYYLELVVCPVTEPFAVRVAYTG